MQFVNFYMQDFSLGKGGILDPKRVRVLKLNFMIFWAVCWAKSRVIICIQVIKYITGIYWEWVRQITWNFQSHYYYYWGCKYVWLWLRLLLTLTTCNCWQWLLHPLVTTLRECLTKPKLIMCMLDPKRAYQQHRRNRWGD